jgi:membrane protein implicated in regulation of membrane protease activity
VQLVPSLVAIAVLVMGSAAPALAYVGPGAGLSLVGAFWGLLVAVFAAFAFVIAWPLRRLLRRRRGAPAETAPESPLPSDKRPALAI